MADDQTDCGRRLVEATAARAAASVKLMTAGSAFDTSSIVFASPTGGGFSADAEWELREAGRRLRESNLRLARAIAETFRLLLVATESRSAPDVALPPAAYARLRAELPKAGPEPAGRLVGGFPRLGGIEISAWPSLAELGLIVVASRLLPDDHGLPVLPDAANPLPPLLPPIQRPA